MPVRRDLTGQKFGRLLVLEYAGADKGQRTQWLCLCDCGKKKVLGGQTMTRPKFPVQSCGCIRDEWRTKLSRSDPRRPAINRAFSGFKNSAKIRKIPIDLTFEQWLSLAVQDCHYCGCSPKNYSKPICSIIATPEIFYYNGLDRKDSEKGYTVDNCVPCCIDCNKGKMKQSYDEFLKRAEKIYKNRVTKLTAYTGI